MNSRKKYKDMVNISGNKIKKIKNEQKLSREKLSNKLLLEEGIDIPAQSIVHIENNTRTVTDYELYGISKILNVEISTLLDP